MGDEGNTRIDLGDDLLEKTAVIVVGGQESEKVRAPEGSEAGEIAATHSSPIAGLSLDRPMDLSEVEDFLENAKILASEGFSEDAKKILHKILIVDPRNIVARQALDGIHELELKQIFGVEETRRPYQNRVRSFPGSDIDPAALMMKLDRDLQLGLATPSTLFESQELLDDFSAKLERDLLNAKVSPQDRIDLGIGFLEMDLFTVAADLFQGACRRLDPDSPQEKLTLLSATCLLVLTYILSGKSYDAISRIQPLLRDSEIKKEDKIELYYLMGRAYETIHRMELANYFYLQVTELDPNYRDIRYRLKAV